MTASTRVRRMTLCGLFSALIAIGAFIQIPVPFMDYFTLQFLFVLPARRPRTPPPRWFH